LCVLELEHEEDLARLGGFLSGASAARMASEEVVLRRLWHRLPWLALGLLGAMTSANERKRPRWQMTGCGFSSA